VVGSATTCRLDRRGGVAARQNGIVRFLRALLVAAATAGGLLLAVLVTAVAYSEWGPVARCRDLIVIEPDSGLTACAAATAPWWLLLGIGLVVGAGSGWTTARVTRPLEGERQAGR
jgi:hypothetical protein